MERKKDRWLGLDALRGLAVLLMLVVNAGMAFDNMPPWMKHSPGTGMRMADFIMPAFLFALGLSQAFSLERRRQKEPLGRTLGHAFLRNLLLFVFGSVGYFLVWKRQSWEILQMLGLSGALAFPFLFLPPGWRSLVVLLMAAGVEALRPSFFEPAFRAWYESGIGGPLGAVPLSGVIIAASIFGEDLVDRRPLFRGVASAVIGLLVAGSGLAMARWIPVDKHLLTLSYLLIAVGATALVLAPLEGMLALLSRRRKGEGADFPVLGALGRNPLLSYMAGGVLTLAARSFLPQNAAAGTAWAASFGVAAIMTIVAILLDRKGLWLRL